VIESADLERFRTFHAERYVTEPLVVAVVGAVSHERAAEAVARAFGLPPGKPSSRRARVEPPQEALRVWFSQRS